MTKDKKKLRAQVKSRWYYTFWGTATVAVVSWSTLCWIWISSDVKKFQ